VLFAALAIEAFANELLAELLEARDLEAVDRLEVPDKLLIGARLATGQSPLSRGAQPLQDVAALVKKRNRLVHPKPHNGIAAWIQDVEAEDEEAIGPRAAATASRHGHLESLGDDGAVHGTAGVPEYARRRRQDDSQPSCDAAGPHCARRTEDP